MNCALLVEINTINKMHGIYVIIKVMIHLSLLQIL